MNEFGTKSPQLTSFLKIRKPERVVEIQPLPNNPTKAKFIVTPCDDDLYRDVAMFNDATTQVSLADYLHELASLRDRVRATLRGGAR